MATGKKSNGRLKKGYRYVKGGGGRVVKAGKSSSGGKKKKGGRRKKFLGIL